MLGFQGDGKVPEDLNEARPNGLALDLRVLFALCSKLLRRPTKEQIFCFPCKGIRDKGIMAAQGIKAARAACTAIILCCARDQGIMAAKG